MPTQSGFDALLERIPYGDGAVRRRLITGVIVGATAWWALGDAFKVALTASALSDIFSHPLPSFAAGASIYLLGTLVEIVGNVSLVRAAAEGIRELKVSMPDGAPPRPFKYLFWLFVAGWLLNLVLFASVPSSAWSRLPDWRFSAWQDFQQSGYEFVSLGWGQLNLAALVTGLILSVPFALVGFGIRRSAPSIAASGSFERFERLMDRVVFCAWWCVRVPVATIRGFIFGQTTYALNLPGSLSAHGNDLLQTMPERVGEGLNKPLGQYGDLALHYSVELFRSPSRRKWANQLIGRVRDVSAIVSSVVVSIVIVLGATVVSSASDDGQSNDDALTDAINSANDAIRQAYDAVRAGDKGFSFSSDSDPDTLSGYLNLAESLATDEPSQKAAIQNARGEIERLRAAERAVATARSDRIMGVVFVAVVLQGVLFFYWVLFVTLRGAIESIVEALAIERSESL